MSLDLNSILPEYKKISEAPGLRQLEEESERLKLPLFKLLEAEAKKLYKAADVHGGVWLVVNPAAWKAYEETRGSLRYVGVKRPLPKQALTAKQAKDAGGSYEPREKGPRKDLF